MQELVKLTLDTFGTQPLKLDKLEASGSHRTYYRIRLPERSIIGVVGTDAKENAAFISFAKCFLAEGVAVPEVYAVSDDGMRYLQEDLGTVSLYDSVREGRSTGHYSPEEEQLLVSTIKCLPAIQLAKVDFSCCFSTRHFDGRAVDFDLNYFKYCFLKLYKGDFDEVKLQNDFEKLRADLLSIPSDTFLYRDFQARNVMLREGKPYFIDFQGGFQGPLHYDLASFICQASARYSEALRGRLVEAYLDSLEKRVNIDRDKFRSELDIFILFRLLQVLGCYGFRGLYEKKRYFIDSIPPALEQIRFRLPFRDYPYLSSLLETICMNQLKSSLLPLEEPLTVEVLSFSYKKGLPEDSSGNGGGYIFDCRAVHNPGRYPEYRSLTGLDREVIDFLEDDGEILRFLSPVYTLADSHVERYLERGFTHLQFAFGCTGGQHRSVYSAEHLAAHLKEKFGDRIVVDLHHRELSKR